jgi:hypothetical protein
MLLSFLLHSTAEEEERAVRITEEHHSVVMDQLQSKADLKLVKKLGLFAE